MKQSDSYCNAKVDKPGQLKIWDEIWSFIANKQPLSSGWHSDGQKKVTAQFTLDLLFRYHQNRIRFIHTTALSCQLYQNEWKYRNIKKNVNDLKSATEKYYYMNGIWTETSLSSALQTAMKFGKERKKVFLSNRPPNKFGNFTFLRIFECKS